MAKLLTNLRGMPDDEIDEIRALLREHNVDYYETAPNRWGLTLGAIWLRDEEQWPYARRLLDEYQQQRAARARAEHAERRRLGTEETIAKRFRNNPLSFLLLMAAVAAILYFSIVPFLRLAG